MPPVYFGANGQDVAEDQKSSVVEPGYLKVLVNGAPPPVARPTGERWHGQQRAPAGAGRVDRITR